MIPNQTPAPQELKVTLDGGLTLVVPDISKPVWFGTYYTGKLAIYAALVQIDEPQDKTALEHLRNSMVYLCTLTETGNADFMTYAPYEHNMPVDAVCSHLLEVVWDAYNKQLQENSLVTYHEAPNQLQ